MKNLNGHDKAETHGQCAQQFLSLLGIISNACWSSPSTVANLDRLTLSPWAEPIDLQRYILTEYRMMPH